MVAAITRAGLEAEIARVISRFHEDQHGHRAQHTVAYVVGDMVLIKSGGCYTQTEEHLALTDDGRKLVKSARRELRSLTRRQAERQVSDIVGVKVLRSYWDLDVRVGEQVEVYILEHDLTETLR
jgi:uncharacterized protein YbcI